jgi:hypothetical protein
MEPISPLSIYVRRSFVVTPAGDGVEPVVYVGTHAQVTEQGHLVIRDGGVAVAALGLGEWKRFEPVKEDG